MKLFVLSLLMGLVVGVLYALVGVRSPAPPIVALVGLLGIVLGEQLAATAFRTTAAGLPPAAAPEPACADPASRTEDPTS
jgi:XapX domain-containing protein